MKHLFCLVFLILSFNKNFAQTLPNYDEIALVAKEDFNEQANDAALQAANYLLSTPMDTKNLDRNKSLLYLLKWMAGSPDYSFVLDQQVTKVAKNNDDLLGLYMAAMTKYVLENKAASNNQNMIKLNAFKLIINYAKNANNKVKINKELKKLIEADETGKLEKYLKI
jgi:hypothetical protein